MGGGYSKLLATLDGFKYLEALKVSKSSTKNKKGFTLAEVLITLGIIGVVAAITMPMLITNVRNQVRAKRIENIEQKFSKATDKMVALGVYTGLGSTENFVNELGKHLKLAKVCDNDNLQSCWPYEKVLTRVNTNTLWEISKTKEASELKMKDDDYSEWDKTMGIITADGTSMILSYNTKCDIDETKPINYSDSISSTTGCVALVYDWNGATKPNKYGDDVLSINAKGLHNSCGAVEVGNDLCFTRAIAYEPILWADAQEMHKNGIYEKLGINNLCNNDRCKTRGDYWAGAVKACNGKKNLPSMLQLAKLADEVYLTKNYFSSNGWTQVYPNYSIKINFQLNSPTAIALQLTPRFTLWSREETSSDYSYARFFDTDSTGWEPVGLRDSGGCYTICLD